MEPLSASHHPASDARQANAAREMGLTRHVRVCYTASPLPTHACDPVTVERRATIPGTIPTEYAT